MSSFFSRKCILPPLLFPKYFIPKLRHQGAICLFWEKNGTMAYLETDLCLAHIIFQKQIFFVCHRLKFEYISKNNRLLTIFNLNLLKEVLKNRIQVSKYGHGISFPNQQMAPWRRNFETKDFGCTQEWVWEGEMWWLYY